VDNYKCQSPSTIFGRSHSIPDEDRIISFDNLLEARLSLELYGEISSFANIPFEDI
jgi:hypothetical protein